MDHETITKNTVELVNGYPNTYTYTKNLAERYLERYRGNLRVIINRPTAIYGCVREPMPGWVDNVTPIGTLGYPYALGMARSFYLKNIVLDNVPGDIVTNQIIVTTAYATTTLEPEFKIFHNAITGINPIKIYDFWKSGTEYLKYNPSEKQVRDPSLWLTGDKKAYKRVIYFQDDLPAKIMEAISNIPFIGSKKMQDDSKRFKKMRVGVEQIQLDLEKFRTTQWTFDSTNV